MTIKEALQKGIGILSGKKIKSAPLDSEIILLYSLIQHKDHTLPNPDSDRSWLWAHGDYNLTKNQESRFFAFIRRRSLFEPVAYITGKKEFYGLEFYVDKNVLIPRPETEIMIEKSLQDILTAMNKNPEKTFNIADIGTGSGAIAISLAYSLSQKKPNGKYRIFASDVSVKSLKIARFNAKKSGVSDKIFFYKGNLWKAFPKKTEFDFVLANLPYLPKKLYSNINEYLKIKNIRIENFKSLRFEPKIALTDNNTGLNMIEELLRAAKPHIGVQAEILLEFSPEQKKDLNILIKKHFSKNAKIEFVKDLNNQFRMAIISLPNQ